MLILRPLTLCFVICLLLAPLGCGGKSEYQQGYDEGYRQGRAAGGTRGLPPPEGKSADYQKGFADGWRAGLRDNPRGFFKVGGEKGGEEKKDG